MLLVESSSSDVRAIYLTVESPTKDDMPGEGLMTVREVSGQVGVSGQEGGWCHSIYHTRRVQIIDKPGHSTALPWKRLIALNC